MKRTIIGLATMLVVFAALLVLSVAHPVRRVRAHTGCTEATLEGTYGLVASGWYYDATEAFPGNFSMLVTFNGSGAFTGDELNIISYELTPSPGIQPQTGSPFSNVSGTYTVNTDCSYTFTIPNPTTPPHNPWNATIHAYGVTVDTGGDEIMGNMYSSGLNSTATFDAKRVATGKWNFFE